ncbi:MAG: WXG100 family type VII secretion target [Solobacterium sp.]|nr:WXG100 family type VII secretion target [Solobacterium sp.]
MAGIRISLDEVSQAAAAIRRLNGSIYESVTAMRREMEKLDGTWISRGSSEIRERFMLFSRRFEEQKEVIESYADFLDMTVLSYETLETTIQSNASDLQY